MRPIYRSVVILSRKRAEELICGNFPPDAAVISFYDPGDPPVDYSAVCHRVLSLPVPDLDCDGIGEYSSFFPQAEETAAFVRRAAAEGRTILCQCDYGEGRSAGCAAAILQYYEGEGLRIFEDFRYTPNRPVYHKLLAALLKETTEKITENSIYAERYPENLQGGYE